MSEHTRKLEIDVTNCMIVMMEQKCPYLRESDEYGYCLCKMGSVNTVFFGKHPNKVVETKREAMSRLFETCPYKIRNIYEEAVRLVLSYQSPSICLLQRRLNVCYSRADRLLRDMVKNGVLAERDGTGPYRILMTLGEWETYR